MANLEPYTGDTKLAIAFDIGTTFSGISYCILERGQVPEIHGVTRFPGQTKVGGDAKVPSLLYYDKNGHVRAAGAEVLSEGIIEAALIEGWTKAEWWKLHLCPGHLASSTNEDDDLPPLPPGKSAVHVLADFIKYLFQCARTFIKEHHITFSWSSAKGSIEYIFTHPNGWEGIQQQLYRLAAEFAGLVPNTSDGRSCIHLLTEGEASFHYSIANLVNMETTDEATPQGVVIIDAGGGTVDLSMFSMTSNQISCEEIAPAECRLQGSVFVTRRARVLIEAKLEGWEHSTAEEIADFTREFDQTTKLVIKSNQEPAYTKVAGRRYNNSKYGISFGKLKWTGKEATGLFDESIDAIIAAFEQQQRSAETPITMAFLVGGLSTNNWLWSRLQSYFRKKNINICRPDNHINKAVANGAVLSRIDRGNYKVTLRIAGATYGFICALPAEENNEEHARREHQWERDPTGECYVPDYFEVKLFKGDKFGEGTEFQESFSLTESNPGDFVVQSVRLECYRGNLRDPEWVDQDQSSFFPFCTIHVDLGRAAKDSTKKKGPSGQICYQLHYDVVVYFGLSEIQAYLVWKAKDGEHRIPAAVSFEDPAFDAEDVDGSRRPKQPRKARPLENKAQLLGLDNDQDAEQIAALRRDNEALQRDFTAASDRIKELQQRHDTQSEELVSANRELTARTLLIEEKDRFITSFTTQVVELKRFNAEQAKQIATSREEYEKLQSDSSSQIEELRKLCDSVQNELHACRVQIEEKDCTIAGLNASIERSKHVDATKTDELRAEEKEKLQQDLAALSSQRADVQVRCDVQSKEIASLRKEVQTKATLLAEKEHIITSLTTERDLARREDATKAGLVTTARQDTELLWQQLSAAWDQNEGLQRRFDAQLIELNSLHIELGRTKILAKESGVNVSNSDSTREFSHLLEQKENETEGLRQVLVAATSRNNELQKSQEELSSKVSALGAELNLKTSRYEGAQLAIASLTVQVNQWRVADVNKTEQLAIALDEVQALRMELTTVTTQFTELQDRYATQSKELVFVNNRLQTATLSVKETDRTIFLLTSERDQQLERIVKLRGELECLSGAKEKEVVAARQGVDELQVKLDVSTSLVTKLEHDCKAHSAELYFLQQQFSTVPPDSTAEEWEIIKTKILSEVHDYTSVIKLTAIVEEWMSSDSKRAQVLALELKKRNWENEELRRKLVTLREIYIRAPRIKEIFQSETIEIKRRHEEEVKCLRTALSDSQSQLRGVQRVVTTTHSAEISQITELRRRCESQSAEIKFLQGKLDAPTSQAARLEHDCKAHSAELQFLQQQFSTIPSDSTAEEWEITKTKILSEVHDYTDVIKLTAIVDEWMSSDSKRAEVLALELEKRDKENEELRRKLVTLREIYIRAPRIKEIFQSETIEIKRRHEEEMKGLKTALSDSQSQLRGIQRIVATADTYADETILSELKKLNAKVVENTTYMTERIAEGFRPGAAKLTKEQSQSVSRSIGKALANALASMKEEEVGLYLPIAFQAFFSHLLHQSISSWTIEKEHNDFINEIYERLQKGESQPMSGRWRALTHAYISPTWISNSSLIVKQITTELSYVVVMARCATSVYAAESKIFSFKEKVLSILMIAGRFSEMIGKTLSADFSVVAPAYLQVFDETTMEEEDPDDSDQGKAASQKVLCSTQLGMTKRMQRESGSETLTVLKARVFFESLLDG